MMGKVVGFSTKKKQPATARPARRKVGRDFFAVLVIGIGAGLGLGWTGIDTSGAVTLLQTAADRVTTLATNLTSPGAGGQDEFPVSSIAKTPSTQNQRVTQQSAGRRYPVCPDAGARRSDCVIDGDTFYFGTTKVRISDIDAPETHPLRCAREADLGDRATRRLAQLLSAGAFQLVRADRDLDRYGRQLRIVVRDGRSLGRTLVSEGLARPWTGKRRPWCGNQDSFG